jgi:hypothetical protein
MKVLINCKSMYFMSCSCGFQYFDVMDVYQYWTINIKDEQRIFRLKSHFISDS